MSDVTTAILSGVASDWRTWWLDVSLPLWWREGRISNGRFLEGLNLDGTPLTSRHSRIRVQGRQLFCFCLAARFGWQHSKLHQALTDSVVAFTESCFRPDNIVGHKIDIDTGSIVEDTADLYDAAFCLLALAEATAVLGRTVTEQALGRFFYGLDTHIANTSDGGFLEYYPVHRKRLQNPHMHLFEALLRLFDATGDNKILARADALLDFISHTFFDFKNDCITEVVGADGREDTQFEPGHSMEWVWLLAYHARLADRPIHTFAQRLYQRVVELDIAPGMLPLGIALGSADSDTRRRLWSQMEDLKAHLAMSEHFSDNATYLERARETAQAIQTIWIDRSSVRGGWFEHVDPDGAVTSTFMPASSGYHVYFAVSELLRVAGRH